MFLRRPGGQAQFSRFLAPEATHAPRRSSLLEWIPGQLSGDLSLEALAERDAADLSHGEQQWLDLGMVLCLQPSVVLLDEPAAGMTGDERRELSQLVRVLAETAAVVVVEHDMAFVRTLDAEVTVLHRGEVFAQGDLDTLRQDEHSSMFEAIEIGGGYGKTSIVERASLSVGRGEIVALLGRNGVGKSTLMRLLVGQATPMGGNA
eukprot:gene1795-2108_t